MCGDPCEGIVDFTVLIMIEIFDNIRQIYEFSPPCEELEPYIEFFSESSASATAQLFGNETFCVQLFPSWTPTFWINLGVPYYLAGQQGYSPIPKNKDILVLRSNNLTRHNQANDHIFTVKFYPGGLEAILGINQAAFVDQVVDLRHVLPAQLLQQVKQSETFQARMDWIQTYFLQQYQQHKSAKDHYLRFVQDSIDTYCASALQFNTSQLAEKSFVSSKTINRYFHKVVGLSPKKYFSILRARTALSAYVQESHSFAAEAYGYHDRSHFYREMVKFTGQRMLERKL